MFIIAGAYYFLSAQRIINEDFMDHSVRQMVGLMYLSDVGFNLVTAHLASKSEGKKKASKKSSAPLGGTPRPGPEPPPAHLPRRARVRV